MTLLKLLSKTLRQAVMGKPSRKPKGKSARKGNMPSPYTKYGKTPYKYSQSYYDWHRNAKAGRTTSTQEKPHNSRRELREYKIAAE
jgi:hypothetical protein